MADEERGIKELVELLEGLEVLASAAGAVLEDGKVRLNDVSVVIDLGSKFQVLADAVGGLSDVPKEAKDLSEEEVKQLVSKVYDVYEAFVAAKKGDGE